MLSKFFMAQWKYPCNGDWTEKAKKDLAEFEIPEELDYIRSFSAQSFKSIVKKRAKHLAFINFMAKRESLSKLENFMYTELSMQSYLKSDQFSVSEARLI